MAAISVDTRWEAVEITVPGGRNQRVPFIGWTEGQGAGEIVVLDDTGTQDSPVLLSHFLQAVVWSGATWHLIPAEVTR